MVDQTPVNTKLNELWQIFWSWAGRVPLRVKIIGIAVIPSLLTGACTAWWLHRHLPARMQSAIDQQNLASVTSASVLHVLLITAASVLGGLVVAWLMTVVLTQPILKVAQAAREVEQGRLDRRVPVWANDEIGHLTSRFNTMVDSMARSQAVQEALIDRLRQRNEELSALYDLAGMASQSFNTEYVLNNGLARVLELVEAHAGMIALFDESRETLTLRAERGMPEPLLDIETLYCTDGGLVCQVVETGRPLLVKDVHTSPDVPPDFVEAAARSGYCSFFSAPILVRGEMLGVLNAFSHESILLDDDRISLLVAVCNQLGIAIENSRLWEEVKRKELVRAKLLAKAVSAQEQERRRISRELHDETGQALTTLLVQLTITEELSDLDAIYNHIRSLRKTVSQTIEEVRRLSLDLRPSTLDDLGLIPTLEWYVEEYERNTEINVHFSVKNMQDVPVSHEIEVELYRVIQEALTNVTRHARAEAVWVELERKKNVVIVGIRDDGRGFDAGAALALESQSLGLLGMQERMELLGGTFALTSNPGQGTQLRLTVPITEERHPIP